MTTDSLPRILVNYKPVGYRNSGRGIAGRGEVGTGVSAVETLGYNGNRHTEYSCVVHFTTLSVAEVYSAEW
jgi:hypothetical protein